MPQPADVHIQTSAQRTLAFVPLGLEQRTHVDTASAAHHLGRRPQTMRVWASTEKGPIRPVSINGRLSWSVAEIRRLFVSSES
jgi:hypothetical protein